MPPSPAGVGARTPTLDLLCILFGVVGVVSLVLGFVGLERLLPDGRLVDLLYYDLQLFVLGSDPLQQGGPFPVPLEVARFTAPAVTIYALVEAGRLLFATEVRRLRARRAQDHVIVCGDTLMAVALASRVRAAGHVVVTVRAPQVPTDGSARPVPVPLMVAGDARDPDVLRAAGIGRATALYACTDDSATNTAIVLAARRLARDASRRLAAYAQVADPDLCLALQARYLGLPQPAGLRLDFFNIDDLAARQLFADEPLLGVREQPPTILVVGGTAFGRAVVVEIVRGWRALVGEDTPLLPLVLVDEAATRTVEQLGLRYPFLGKTCELTPYDGDLSTVAEGHALHRPYDRVFICYDDEESALKTALTTEWLWRGGRRSVLVRLDRLAVLRDAFEGPVGDRVLDELSGALRLYGVVDGASHTALLGDDLVERLARVIHERYELTRLRAGDTERVTPGMIAWDDLPEAQRRSNRAQAEDIGRKLREVGCMLSPRVEAGHESVLSEADVERLARLEHERWRAQYVEAGWRYDERRDDARLHHPSLLDWAELPETTRKKNYDVIRELPAILADAGFRIVRM